MIFSAIIYISTYLITVVTSIFPNSDGLPVEITEAVTYFSGYIGILSPVVPFDTLSTVLTLIIAFELVVFGFKTFKWLFSHVPQIGGRG